MAGRRRGAHIADVDCLDLLGSRSGEVGEWVGRSVGHASRVVEPAAGRATAGRATKATAATEATKAATAGKATSTGKATTNTTKGTTAAAEATTTVATTTSHGGTGETVLADLKHATLPIVSIELLDGIPGVVGCLEDDDAGALGATIRTHVNIGSDHATGAGYRGLAYTPASHIVVDERILTGLTEQVLEILPANGVGELHLVNIALTLNATLV